MATETMDDRGAARRAGRAWMRAGEAAAHALGVALFAVLWVVAMGPVALGLKLANRRFLPEFANDAPTYFVTRPPAGAAAEIDAMKRQG